MLLEYNPRAGLPSAQDLPDSDDTPVDNLLQHLIPMLLEIILDSIWSERIDWFFGVNMGIYYDPEEPAIVPDGFLSLGVSRTSEIGMRPSYVLWEERQVPTLVLEVVSKTRGGEYSRKKEQYAQMGVLYYVIYNDLRKRKPKLEVYQLEGNEYRLLSGDIIWFPELQLGIGRAEGKFQGTTREWLYWYDENGERYPTPDERTERERQRAEIAEAERDRQQERAEAAESALQELRDRLRQSNIDPDSLLGFG
ncbi:Uma2 family endonuclease [Roseofilum casamattae]|uniref:Uma2 family endonuclease n=1 Tax=Roseofilum casamattae BLCC-M143 TaxID=3022442 RepID=A0ABT7BVV7_9CYAN|nr:Uma2 family endonuclease [Roseofilum casamattae]MDJ1183332.1 Uma2 family endonuclease [Roseofilum casamattae BLCC-M143]